MYDLPENSVEFFNFSIRKDHISYKNIPFNVFVNRMNAISKKGIKDPYLAALTFYFYNHAQQLINNKFGNNHIPSNLIEVLKNGYIDVDLICQKMFFQTILASQNHLFGLEDKNNFHHYFKNRFGEELFNYHVKRYTGFMIGTSIKLNTTVGEFLASTSSSMHNNGFGALRWALIADLPLNFVNGTMSLETMTDQAFSICHHGGTILNKGHMFDVANEAELANILNAQDTGQLLKCVYNGKFNHYEKIKKDCLILAEYFEEIKEPIDKAAIDATAKNRAKYVACQINKNGQPMNNNILNPLNNNNKLVKKEDIIIENQNKKNRILLGLK